MPDKDGYPTGSELGKIKKLKTPAELIEHVRSIWWTADYLILERRGTDRLTGRKVFKLQLHTGGWSGNEEIIANLEKHGFWFLYWCRSDRGGHFYFEIPKDKMDSCCQL